MKKIIVADDEQLIRRLVCDFLKKENYETLEAEDGSQALALFNANPDVSLLILDIMMPEIDGWELCRRIRKKSDAPIILLSARSQEFDQLTGFEVGADDYVTKPFSPTVLVKRVEALLKRKGYSPEDSGKIFLDTLVLDKNAHRVTVGEKEISLTLKEFELLEKLLASADRVFSREQLLDDIWGYTYEGDTRTVDSHLARLRTKLGEWGDRHIVTVYGLGYKLDREGVRE
jgi:DNA-binding response OmpR family regulator